MVPEVEVRLCGLEFQQRGKPLSIDLKVFQAMCQTTLQWDTGSQVTFLVFFPLLINIAKELYDIQLENSSNAKRSMIIKQVF